MQTNHDKIFISLRQVMLIMFRMALTL